MVEQLLCKNKLEGPGLQFREDKPHWGYDCGLQSHGGGCPSASRTVRY